MELTLLKAKLHRACTTHAEVDYEGSCAIDADLLAAAGILPHEQIEIYNVRACCRFIRPRVVPQNRASQGAVRRPWSFQDQALQRRMARFWGATRRAGAIFPQSYVAVRYGNQLSHARCALSCEKMATGAASYEAATGPDNGERFSTYAIRADAGSRIISVNGAAAHKATPGDRLIICAYARMSEAEARAHEPSLVYLDADNRVTHTRNAIPSQAA